MVNVLLMATGINVIVNQDIPAANVKVSITSHDFSNRDQPMEKVKITFLCLILDSWNTAVRFFLKK
jgi:hypothetical protein